MKAVALLALLTISTFISAFNFFGIRIQRTFTQAQIKQVEQQVAKEFGNKVEIKVISRDLENEILGIKITFFDKNGHETASCSSDDFGWAEIKQDACSIADRDHGNQPQ
jgi:hypothetical protein